MISTPMFQVGFRRRRRTRGAITVALLLSGTALLMAVPPATASTRSVTTENSSAAASVDDTGPFTGPAQISYSAAWAKAASAQAYDGTNTYTNTAGAVATVTFTGTAVAYYAVLDATHGIATVSLDGAPATSVDLYAATRAGNQLVWTSPTLPNGRHTLRITATGTKDARASWNWITVDRIDVTQPPFGSPPVRGADLSFAVQEQLAGTVFRDHGTASTPEQILANHGANYDRIRVWVNPPPAYSDETLALTEGKRAAAAGMKILLDPQYSDTWTDPDHQAVPQAWLGQTFSQLTATIGSYTAGLVASFAAQGTPISILQIGNETTTGMLFPAGSNQNWAAYATLVKAAITGARSANPSGNTLRVMLHIDRGGDNPTARWFFDNVAAQAIPYDIIGLSYYPFWQGSLATMTANVNDLATRYNKDILLAETDYPWTLNSPAGGWTTASNLPDLATYPATVAGQASYYAALRRILAAVPGGHGLGFLAWEPDWLAAVGATPSSGDPAVNLTMFDTAGNAFDQTLDAAYQP